MVIVLKSCLRQHDGLLSWVLTIFDSVVLWWLDLSSQLFKITLKNETTVIRGKLLALELFDSRKGSLNTDDVSGMEEK